MVQISDYKRKCEIAWCPGCGNFGILGAVQKALVKLGKEPHEVVIVSGIGQAPKLPHYMYANVFNGLHGRSLPAATAIKLANSKLTVIVVGGDGDGYAEGGNHFLHAMRRNIDITYLVHDNQIYGLTKGQASPTTEPGYITGTTPWGVLTAPFRPLPLAISMDVGFVARGFSGDQEHLANLIVQGVNHKGFSFIDVLQPCVSFNHLNTHHWYRERVYYIDESHNRKDKVAAWQLAHEWGDRIPIGVLYEGDRPAYNELVPAIKEMPLVDQPFVKEKLTKLNEDFLPRAE